MYIAIWIEPSFKGHLHVQWNLSIMEKLRKCFCLLSEVHERFNLYCSVHQQLSVIIFMEESAIERFHNTRQIALVQLVC